MAEFKHTHYDFFKTVLNGKDAPMDIQILASMAPDSICGCSSCKEALDVAIRDAKELIKTQCPASLLMYGQFLQMIAKASVAASMHEQNPTASARDILASAMENTDNALSQIAMVGIKMTPEIYDAGEEIAVAYLARVL